MFHILHNKAQVGCRNQDFWSDLEIWNVSKIEKYNFLSTGKMLQAVTCLVTLSDSRVSTWIPFEYLHIRTHEKVNVRSYKTKTLVGKLSFVCSHKPASLVAACHYHVIYFSIYKPL